MRTRDKQERSRFWSQSQRNTDSVCELHTKKTHVLLDKEIGEITQKKKDAYNILFIEDTKLSTQNIVRVVCSVVGIAFM